MTDNGPEVVPVGHTDDAGHRPDERPTRREHRNSGRQRRAGRDLRAATAVGAFLAVLVGTSLFVWKPAFVGLVAAAATVAVWELSHALGRRGIRVPLVPVLLSAVLLAVAAFIGGPDALTAALGLSVVAVLIWRLGERDAGYARDVAAGIFVTLYVPFLAAFAAVLLRPDDGPWRVLTVIAVVVASDTGGYVAGVLTGRHLMAPSVSPNKSWEGFVGSVLLASGVGIAGVVLLLDGDWKSGLVLGVAIMLAATLGDLGESLIKRDLGIKDMSTLLPGHGGLMDRVDSLLISLPVAWVVLTELVEVA
ncbi:MAG TPA: phosphatidate cytidylyltransferase [Jiangellaceae bacterium]